MRHFQLILLILFSLFMLACDSEDLEQESKGIPNEYFFAQRAYPTGKISNKAYREAISWKKNHLASDRGRNDKTWEFIGPTNSGGRLTCVEALPDDPNTIYIGAASGGVFKTSDRGLSWRPIFDDAGSLAIGDLSISSLDPSIIYVGTGEANAGGGSLAYDGDGVYRSDDGGESWDNIGLPDAGSIGRIVIHPDNPDKVYVAAMGYLFEDNPDRGVFRSEDGGEQWEKILFVNDSTGAIDLAMHPDNPDILYAATWERIRRPSRRKYGGLGSGLYRSMNGGNSWELINVPQAGTIKGRIGLAINPAAPDDLAVYVADATGFTSVIAYSQDRGDTFQVLPPPLDDVSYNWWFGRLAMDPHHVGDIIQIGLDVHHLSTSTNGNWEQIFEGVHVDQHDLYIHPNEAGLYYVANDGGLYISENSGEDWSHINNLPITQFYTCEIDPLDPDRHYGGSQDNGSNRSINSEPDSWQFIFGGDGFVNIVDPRDNNRIYVEYQYGNLFRSDDDGQTWTNLLENFPGGQRKNWNTPVRLDPINPDIIYYGTSRLWKSINRGIDWQVISLDLAEENSQGNLVYGTLTSIDISRLDHNVILTGTDNGRVWLTNNGGNSWDKISDGIPDRWITSVAIDPNDTEILLVTLSGFRNNESISHVYKTLDQGINWQNIGNQLPDIPINKIIIDPIKEDTYYIATDIGVFISENAGNNWESLGNALPNTPITDIDINTNQQKLLAATYGRSMYTYDLSEEVVISEKNVRQFNLYPQPANNAIHLEGDNIEGINGIYNATGNKINIQWRQLSNTHWTLDINRINSGIYFISINSGGNNYLKRMIKI